MKRLVVAFAAVGLTAGLSVAVAAPASAAPSASLCVHVQVNDQSQSVCLPGS